MRRRPLNTNRGRKAGPSHYRGRCFGELSTEFAHAAAAHAYPNCYPCEIAPGGRAERRRKGIVAKARAGAAAEACGRAATHEDSFPASSCEIPGRCLGKYRRRSLPQHLADRALQSGMAWPDGDKRSHGQEGAFGMVIPHPDHCDWIGEPPAVAPAPKSIAPPIRHSAFEEVIGKPFPASMSRPAPAEPMAVTGTRGTAPDIDEG
jgi:hypothetical protein